MRTVANTAPQRALFEVNRQRIRLIEASIRSQRVRAVDFSPRLGRGKDDNGNAAQLGIIANTAERLESIEARHVQVKNNQLHRSHILELARPAQKSNGFFAAGYAMNARTRRNLAERLLENLCIDGAVVNQQDVE